MDGVNNTIKFQCIDWFQCEYNNEDDDDGSEDFCARQYLVKVFGRMLDGRAISLDITGYTPHFYLGGIDSRVIARYIELEGVTYDDVINSIRDMINFQLNDTEYINSLVSIKMVRRINLWGFRNNEKNVFLQVSFHNSESMRLIINTLFNSQRDYKIPIFRNQAPFRFTLFENNIEPLLRLIHKRELLPCGWIEVNKSDLRPPMILTHNGICRSISWDRVREAADMRDISAPLRILSFDIECSSYTGGFPLPVGSYKYIAYKLYDYYNNVIGGKDNKMPDKLKSTPPIMIGLYIRELFDTNQLNLEEEISDKERDKNCDTYNEEIITILSGNHYAITIEEEAANIGCGADSDSDEEGKDMTTIAIIERLTQFLHSRFPKLRGDEMRQVGITMHNYGDNSISMRKLLSMDPCAPIEGAIVVNCDGERDLIEKLVAEIIDLDPDIITGYNILGFDFQYIYKRACELGCSRVLCNMGRIKNSEYPQICRYNNGECGFHYCKSMLSSSAIGHNSMTYIRTPGRVIIDMMQYMQRNYKLDMYSLDHVANTYLSGNIISYQADNWLGLDTISGIVEGNALNIADKKYTVMAIDITGNRVKLSEKLADNTAIKWALVKNDIDHHDIFAKLMGSEEDRAIIGKYCIQDCAICNYLIVKLDVMANNIGMANVCLIPFSYIFFRGQGVKIFSLVAEQAKRDGYIIPYLDKRWICSKRGCGYKNRSDNEVCYKCKHGIRPDDDGYEGAIVLDPKPGIYYDTPVSVLDYASLYPSSMISENISPDSIVEPGGEYDNLPGIEYIDIEYDIFVGKEKRRVKSSSRFMQPKDGGKSLYPRILQKLLQARKSTRKKMIWKTVTKRDNESITIIINDDISDDRVLHGVEVNTGKRIELKRADITSIVPYFTDFQLAVLEGAQLAYKLTANSLYGQLGAPTSPIFYKELALSTTATGRKMLLMAKKFAVERYNAEIIYGDTDSIFVRWKADMVPIGYGGYESRDDQLLQYNIDRGCELSDEFRKQLKKPHDLEWEKMFYPFILFGKKKYVGNLYEKDVRKYKQKNQGIVLQRRDNAKLVKTIYGGIIKILLNRRDFHGSIQFMYDSIAKLLAKEYDIEELVITRKLGYGYKFPDRIAHKVLADRMMQRDPGSAPQINDRIPYVYIYPPNDRGKDKILEGEKIEGLKYVRDNNIPINHAYYIEKQLVKPISQLYALELEKLPGYCAKYAIDRDEINRICKKCRDNGIIAENCNECDIAINKRYNELRQQAAIDILFGTRGYTKRMRKFAN